jgi:diacylglycerol kinase (ATP)
MDTDKRGDDRPAGSDERPQWSGQSAMPGAGGLARIVAAAANSANGLKQGFASEAAIRQELALLALALPVSYFLASSFWVAIALIASLLVVLIAEFLNTAIENLCDHVTPDRHDAIRITKDLASAGIFFSLLLAGLVWLAAIAERLGLIG